MLQEYCDCYFMPLLKYCDNQIQMNRHPKVFAFPDFPPPMSHVRDHIIDKKKRRDIEHSIHLRYASKYIPPFADLD